MLREMEQAQNPVLSAILIWRFNIGYGESVGKKAGSPFVLNYVVLPIVYQSQMAEIAASTLPQSGLQGFVSKLKTGRHCRKDLLLTVHEKVVEMIPKSQEAIKHGLVTGLLAYDSIANEFYCDERKSWKKHLPLSVKPLTTSAERLGHWCAELSVYEVSALLKVRF